MYPLGGRRVWEVCENPFSAVAFQQLSFPIMLFTLPHHMTRSVELSNSDPSQLSVQESQHEKVLMISSDGVVHSPGFPHTYPRSTVIVWRLVSASENSRIQLTFDPRFGLEDPEDGVCK
ncbi:platelet-derived growth factor C [Tachysurus ichikawai]